jgi:hypothetical protein
VSSSGGAPPPPPPTALIEELDSGPTMAVSGDLPDPGAPPVTNPAADRNAPVVESAPLPSPPSGGGRKIAIVAALVVLLGLAAVVAGGVFAWRSGLFGFAKAGSDSARQKASSAIPATDTPADVTADTPDDSTVTAAGTTAVGGGQPPAASPVIPARSTLAPDEKLKPEGTTRQPRSSQEMTAREPQGPPPAALPPPDGTVVIAVGDQLLTGAAEAYMEDAFARAGIPLVDEGSIPGISGLIGSGEMPRPGEVHAMLKPYVRNLVMIRVEYLGERPLMYMGQRDVAFQAQVTVVAIDVQNGGAIDPPARFRVEYTHLNAERVVEKEFRQPTFRVIELLR